MTKYYNDKKTAGLAKKEKRNIHMAYTLNNEQPVICTIVSDEPLFYMSEDVTYDEEYLLEEEGAFSASELESEMKKLRHKMEAYDKISTHYSKLKDERVQEFITEGLFLTADEQATPVTLQDIEETLSESMFSQSLLDEAAQLGVDIVLTDAVSTSHFDVDAKQILINQTLDKIDQVLLAVQELRKASLSKTNAFETALNFHPDHAILANRAQKADLSACIIRTAWELKLKGKTQFWDRIENSSLSDLGRAFAREACVDFRALNSGKAMAAVFETWFLSERCRVEDKKLVQAMLSEQELYIAENTKEENQNMVQFIHNLGAQSYGKNYLASYAHMILEDPVFTEVRDRANANFLWFIKFERSFNEAEQQLQPSGEQSAPDVQSGHFEDTDYAIAQKPTTTAMSHGGNVIHIAFGEQGNHSQHVTE